MCCGYSIVSDWSSSISITDSNGIVIYQNVSAIYSVNDGYVVESRGRNSDSERFSLSDCEYNYISKSDNVRSELSGIELQGYHDVISSGMADKIVSNRYSCWDRANF